MSNPKQVVEWKPQSLNQERFHRSPAFEKFYGGAAGGGKSDALMRDALAQIDNPNYRAILFRRTFPEVETSFIEMAHKWYQSQGLIPHDGGKVWEKPGGGKIRFAHLQRERDVHKHQCFHPDTEILTDDGWIKIQLADKSLRALSLNPETREMSWQKITATQQYDYDGDLVVSKSRKGVDFAVTPNHKVWASTAKSNKLKPYFAKDLPVDSYIPRTGMWNGMGLVYEPKIFSAGTRGRDIIFTPEQWFSFLGWYLSEGCVSGKNKRWEIRISQKNKEGRIKIERLLNSVSGLNFWKSDKEYRFSNKELWLYLEDLGKSKDKHIPKYYKNAPLNLLKLLLYSLIDGDGSWYKTRGVFVSSSHQLIDDMCEIAVKCGYSAVVRKCPTNKGYYLKKYGSGDRWHINITPRTKDTSIRKSLKIVHYKGKVYCVTVPPYHTVLIRYNGKVSWSGQSAEYTVIGFDELTSFTEFQYNYMISRCRGTDPTLRKYVMSASNPGNVGHGFVKRRFVDIGPPNTLYRDPITGLLREFIPARVYDNKVLMDNDPLYVKRLMSLPEKDRLALLEGNWDVFEGQFFREWNRDIHVVNPTALDSRFVRFITIDYGYYAPAAVYWGAIDFFGRVTFYKEIYVTGYTLEQLGGLIAETNGDDNVRWFVVDKHLLKTSEESGIPGIEFLKKSMHANKNLKSMRYVQAFDKRIEGWNIMRDYMKPVPSPYGGTTAMVRWFSTCVNAIRTIPELIHDESKPEDVDTDGEDHAGDACRIGLASVAIRPSSKDTRTNEERTIEELNKQWRRKKLQKMKARRKPRAGYI